MHVVAERVRFRAESRSARGRAPRPELETAFIGGFVRLFDGRKLNHCLQIRRLRGDRRRRTKCTTPEVRIVRLRAAELVGAHDLAGDLLDYPSGR